MITWLNVIILSATVSPLCTEDETEVLLISIANCLEWPDPPYLYP